MFPYNNYRRGMRPSMMQPPGMMPPPMMGPGMGPPGMGPGMPPPGMGPDMQGGGYGPPPGYGYVPTGFGEPIGFLPFLSPIAKLVGGLFSRPRPTPAAAPAVPSMPPLFYSNRPQFCQTYCPPTPPAAGAGGGRRRRRRRRSGLSGWGW